MSARIQKRDNNYYLDLLRRKDPSVYHELLEGKHLTVDAALRAAGIKKARTRLQEMINAWNKATPTERDEFKSYIGCSVLSHAAPRPLSARIVSADRKLEPDVIVRIQEIMAKRRIRLGVVMKEMGFKALNPSLGMAMNQGTQIQQRMVEELGKWLDANEEILSEID
jgi:hypothetical protein